MTIYDYVLKNQIKQPIQLEFGQNKYVNDSHATRYIKVFINGVDVALLVANATGYKVSKAKDTCNCIIVHGYGLDIWASIQNRVYREAYQAGYPNMFSQDFYKYLGQKRGKRYFK